MDPSILWLDEPGAADARLSGAKASNLAVARQHGLPVLDGFVLTATASAATRWNGSGTGDALHEAWQRLSGDGRRPLAVRSSSVLEDGAGSSMAGQFRTVLHVDGRDEFAAAVRDVIASAASGGEPGRPAPMAVLVQPMADARVGGVLFGIDPMTGDRSHYLVAAVAGLPDRIVSGEVTGEQVHLGRHGARRGPRPADRRLLARPSPDAGNLLGVRDRRRLARLARDAERLFGAPQDIEWLIDDAGSLRLLQSRPITASAMPLAGGHVLGASPVAETFPEPLARLERDLWEGPLEEGIREALRISGAVGARSLAGRFVVDVGGRVAVDLEALGVVAPRRTWWRLLDPRPPLRRLLAAWRVGRLRGAMPAIAHDLVAQVDGDLRSLAALDRLGDVQLLTVLSNARRTLATLHAYEVLSGFFVDPGRSTATGASVALTTLARARLDGLDDARIVAEHPVVLALTAPHVGGSLLLPPTGASPPGVTRTDVSPTGVAPSPVPPTEAASSDTAPMGPSDALGVSREALRLRVRWVQELTAQVATELGRRLAGRAQLGSPQDVRHVDLVSLREVIERPGTVLDVRPDELGGAPLPDRFRLAVDGSVVPDVVVGPNGTAGGPVGVSSGRVVGVVTHDPLDAAGKVLVVGTLDPALAPAVAVAAGLVAEHGSPLSHLAILAREFGVPAVAAASGATGSLHDGDRVLVDGTVGIVEPVGTKDGLDVTGTGPVERAPVAPGGRRRRGGAT